MYFYRFGNSGTTLPATLALPLTSRLLTPHPHALQPTYRRRLSRKRRLATFIEVRMATLLCSFMCRVCPIPLFCPAYRQHLLCSTTRPSTPLASSRIPSHSRSTDTLLAPQLGRHVPTSAHPPTSARVTTMGKGAGMPARVSPQGHSTLPAGSSMRNRPAPPDEQRPIREPWFFGTRKDDAMAYLSRLTSPGEFCVRESSTNEGEYALAYLDASYQKRQVRVKRLPGPSGGL